MVAGLLCVVRGWRLAAAQAATAVLLVADKLRVVDVKQ
jgi:hypothetical protein